MDSSTGDVVFVILLAGGLGFISSWLNTSAHLVGLVDGFMGASYFPIVIFVLGILTTMATGFSWSSMTLIVPPAIAMSEKFSAYVPFGDHSMIIAVGAAISGAVAGSQLVPYSEKTVMAASVLGVSPLVHSLSQGLHVTVGVLGSVLSYFILAQGVHPLWSFVIGLVFVHSIVSFFAKADFAVSG